MSDETIPKDEVVETVEEHPEVVEEVTPEVSGETETVTTEVTVAETAVVPVGTAPSKSSLDFAEILSAVKCMVSFFTIIRIDVGQKEFDAMEKNFWLAPVLGFINGLVVLAVCLILGMFDVGLIVQAIAAIATVYIFSKFLHFDGLTDFGDGIIVSSGKREDHIRALKDSLIGAGGFGVTLMVVLLTFACYYSMGNTAWAVNYDADMIFGICFVAFAVEILVKNAQVAAAAFGEPGNGMASRQVGNTNIDSLVRSTLVTVVALAIATLIGIGLAGMADYHADFPAGEIILLFLISVLLSVGTGYVMARIANKTFGFVNGDILGATNEISRVVILLVSLMIMGLW